MFFKNEPHRLNRCISPCIHSCSAS